MKRVFIIHGWGATPSSNWHPWLKKELEKNNFKVEVLAMPNADAPEIKSWVEKLKESVGKADEETYFIGHSIGCQTILRYFEGLKGKVGGAVFVAGWFTLNLETEEGKEIAKPWLEREINLEKVKDAKQKWIIGAIVIVLAVIGILYYKSCREAQAWNEGHYTDFTCGDFFWAGDEAKTPRE